jgi:transcriptional regulator GlxA family with amidase domain
MTLDDSHANAILPVCLHVEKHLSEPWSLEQMAALANLSPYHFAHEFSRIKKEHPIHWLTRMRLEQEAIWLKFTTRSTWEIAGECGYQSREGFSRAFSRRFNRLSQWALSQSIPLPGSLPVDSIEKFQKTTIPQDRSRMDQKKYYTLASSGE